MDDFLQGLKSPSPKWRAKPFWAWNGQLDQDELVRQVSIIKEMGNGGFFMHSRIGLKSEYLGQEWFQCINKCADEAEKLGMEAWLYDEDRWPSGIAGGMVTQNPEYRMQSLKLEICTGELFEWDEKILCAYAYKKNGINYSDYRRIFCDDKADLDHMDVLIFRVIQQSPHSFYNGYTYVDTLNKDATQCFIRLTHEKYKSMCGDRFGRSIKGIFTDEPFRGILLNDICAGNDGDNMRVPWTNKLQEEFIKKYGYDLLDRLPELFLLQCGKTVSQVKWHYTELVLEMFINNFLKPVHDWCKENGILLTGHVFHEDTLAIQTITCGSVMRCYEYMDYPGVDVLKEGNRNYWIVKQLASAARQTGKNHLLSELNGCTGWQMDFEAYKRIGDWQAFFGINLRCQHLSWFTMEGQAKRDYPASILHQSAWWHENRYIEDYFARIGFVMSKGEPCCDLLVLNPVESIWCRVYPGWSKGFSALDKRVLELEGIYSMVFEWLSRRHIDFDYGDEGMIAEHGLVCKDDQGYPVFRIGRAEYRTVLVCGMDTIRSSTIGLLKNFKASGGKVIFAGDVPAFQDAVKSPIPGELANIAVKVPMEAGAVCREAAPRPEWVVEISCETGKPEGILCRMRYEEGAKYIMLLNISETEYTDITVDVCCMGGDVNVYELCCTSGELLPTQIENGNGYIKIVTSLVKYGERIFIITADELPVKQSHPPENQVRLYTLPDTCSYELDEPNVCVLDIARYRLQDNVLSEEMEILKLDRHLRQKLGMQYRSGVMIQPWFNRNIIPDKIYKLELEFTFNVAEVPEFAELAIERPDNFEIFINGFTIKKQCSGWWVDKCFSRIPLCTDVLQPGRNNIVLKTDFTGKQDIEAIYLIGNFGVSLDENCKILTRLPRKIKFGDLVSQGLPFYSGGVRYILDFGPISLQKDENAYLEAEKPAAAYIRLVSASGEGRIAAWPPYMIEMAEFTGNSNVVLEAMLTRRNTFGPLHLTCPLPPMYDPETYETEGDEFTMQYGILPSGVLSPPKIVIYRTK